MKKLIIKTSFFVIPFLLLFVIYKSFYQNERGDLVRLGYIFDINDYDRLDAFQKYFDRELRYTRVSKTNLDTINSYDFISIGDSFSNQGNTGYQNCMVYNSKIKLLDIDRNLYDSPISLLYGLINGGFFDKNKTKYVILQNVEREFGKRGLDISKTDKITIAKLKKLINEKKQGKSSNKDHSEIKKEPKDQFFSKENIRFVMYNFNYLYDDNALVSQTYKVKTNKRLFSVPVNNLLFYDADVKILNTNNNKGVIENLNNELNDLSDVLAKTDIKLIVVPAPDKYGIYFDYFVNKEKYEKPIFLDHFNTLKKRYLYVNSKEILTKTIKNKEDVYFYDDTHWSPIAAELIASEILRISK